MPGCEIKYGSNGASDSRSCQVNFSKIADTLPSFRLEWTAYQGDEEMYRALRDTDLTPEDFEGPRYRRIKHIQTLLDRGDLGADLRRSTSQVA